MNRGFMELAIEAALTGIRSGSGGPFGAVVVKEDQILSVAYNTVLDTNLPTRHAEINVIEKAALAIGNIDLSGCELYSTTEPCPMCFSAIHWARVDKIIWGTRIDDVGRLGFNEMFISPEKMKKLGRSEVKVEGPFMRKECLEVLKAWSQMPEDRKIIY